MPREATTIPVTVSRSMGGYRTRQGSFADSGRTWIGTNQVIFQILVRGEGLAGADVRASLETLSPHR